MARTHGGPGGQPMLSVLALSSRFDGESDPGRVAASRDFQYSLCRVVLMVHAIILCACLLQCFQYSLCRVVLMVNLFSGVLRYIVSFSTRSVESF